MKRGDEIAINENAFGISAYVPLISHLHRDPAVLFTLAPSQRWIVVAGKPTDRNGGGGQCPAPWVDACARLVASGAFRYVVHTNDVIALERSEP
jgi:hypothetical protein